MRKFLLLIIILFLSYFVFSQNNSLVINNNAYVVLNGGTVGTPIYVVVDQPNQLGIATLGTGGNIISEGEYNYMKWNISNSTGTYVVPFTTGVGVTESKIPLSMQITTAGNAGGSVLFSTYETADNNTPWSSQVTHMNDAATGASDNSLFVVDRFWQIDAASYTTKPAVTMNFGYNTDPTETGGTNTLTVGNLGAQRFNNATSKWEGWFGAGGAPQAIWGTDNSAGTVSGVVVPSASFYRTWTLSDFASPLPIELVSFTGKCNQKTVLISWETASEQDNDYFVVERSENGIDFYEIGAVQGAGNSSTTLYYTFADENPSSDDSYYRLTQVDYNGNSTSSELIFVSSCDHGTYSVFSSTEGVNVQINTKTEGKADFYLIDMSGRMVGQKHQLNLTRGQNNFIFDKEFATGIYTAVIFGNDINYTTKIMIK